MVIRMARAAALHTQRTDPKNEVALEVFSKCKSTAAALSALMNALKLSSSDSILFFFQWRMRQIFFDFILYIEDLPAVITELVAAAQNSAAPASGLVSVLKLNANSIGANTKIRSDLRTKAEDVAKAIQALLSASQQVCASIN